MNFGMHFISGLREMFEEYTNMFSCNAHTAHHMIVLSCATARKLYDWPLGQWVWFSR